MFDSGAYFYELRAYIYQARHLLSLDNDHLSGTARQIEMIRMKVSSVIID